jgi:hypothetical protein
MEAQTVDTLPPIAADHDPVRCLLAIELSKSSAYASSIVPRAVDSWPARLRVDGNDAPGGRVPSRMASRMR